LDGIWVVGKVEEGFAVGAAIADEALEGISRCSHLVWRCRWGWR